MTRILPGIFLCLILCLGQWAMAQDTFSIVAIDTVTGEIGSAGASCLDNTAISGGAIVISDIQPGIGAIHTQASLNFTNKNNARARMLAGDSPEEIIAWLVANDAQADPSIRQYGIVDTSSNGSVRSAAYTGSNAMNYKGHIIGPNYAIQGNILAGQFILDSMEAGFLNTSGNLAEKLMAALQGANVPGADTRCLSEGVSSQSAFLRVAKPYDLPGNFYLDLNVSQTPFGEEPIDSLQTLFDNWVPRSCEYAIPATAVVVNVDSNLTVNNQVIWVCGADTLRLTGASNTVLLEDSAFCEILGGTSSIQNTIYQKAHTRLEAAGTLQTEVFYDPAASYGNLGIAPTVSTCDSVVYDYAEAPDAGCFAPALGLDPTALQLPWQVQVRPEIHQVQIEFLSTASLHLELINLAGQTLAQWDLPSRETSFAFSTEAYPAGLYVLVLHQGNRSSSKKVMLW